MKRLFSVKNQWDKIPLCNWIAYQKVCDEKLTGVDAVYKKIAALKGIDVLEVKKIKYKELMDFAKVLAQPLPQRLMLSFKHKGKRYRPILDARELDGDKYSAIKLSQSRGMYDGLHQTLFIVSQPEKFGFRKKFPFIGFKDIELTADQIQEGIEDFKTLPMEVANPMAVFFCKVSQELKNLLGDYLNKKMGEMKDQVERLRKDLESSTDSPQ